MLVEQVLGDRQRYWRTGPQDRQEMLVEKVLGDQLDHQEGLDHKDRRGRVIRDQQDHLEGLDHKDRQTCNQGTNRITWRDWTTGDRQELGIKGQQDHQEGLDRKDLQELGIKVQQDHLEGQVLKVQQELGIKVQQDHLRTGPQGPTGTGTQGPTGTDGNEVILGRVEYAPSNTIRYISTTLQVISFKCATIIYYQY